MTIETVVKGRIKKLKETFLEMDENQLEKELIPLSGEDVRIKTMKKRKV